MVFEDRDLAQINATMSVGLLFFLGLTNLFPGDIQSSIPLLVHATFLTLPPFLISLIVAVTGHARLARWITAISLGWLLIYILILLNAISPLIPGEHTWSQ